MQSDDDDNAMELAWAKSRFHEGEHYGPFVAGWLAKLAYSEAEGQRLREALCQILSKLKVADAQTGYGLDMDEAIREAKSMAEKVLGASPELS